jgi:hypothetical protein
MHVRHLPGGEPQVAEDDVLDAARQESVALCAHFARLFLEEVQQDRQVVDAERPERVLVRPECPEVLTVAVDVENVAQLARVDDLLQPLHGGVIKQQMTRHQHSAALFREVAQLLQLGGAHRGRLLDEDVLVRLERAAC